MRFEWDERKRRAKIAKHGLDFRRAVHVFDGPSFTYSSSTQDEPRWVTIGEAQGRLVAVGLDEAIRGGPGHLDEEGEA
jgi:uncharacterized protein